MKGNIGLVVTGYFNAPEDGIYTFNLLSDDGSTLKINGELVVDNDGPHSPREVTGQKALHLLPLNSCHTACKPFLEGVASAAGAYSLLT